jgi:hypothetical protein
LESLKESERRSLLGGTVSLSSGCCLGLLTLRRLSTRAAARLGAYVANLGLGSALGSPLGRATLTLGGLLRWGLLGRASKTMLMSPHASNERHGFRGFENSASIILLEIGHMFLNV